jgi:hypothetical protein
MHAVAKEFVVPAYLGRYLNGFQFFVREVHNLLAAHTDDVMMLRCHRIVA